MRYRNLIKSLSLFSILLVSIMNQLSAHEINYTNQFRGDDIAVSNVMEVKDEQYDFMQNNNDPNLPPKWIDYANSPWPFSNTNDLEFINKTANAWVSLRWTGTDGVAFSNTWEMTVNVGIHAWTSDGTYLGQTNEDLTIDYIPGNKVEYDDWSVIEIKNAHRLVIAINGISITDATGTTTNYNQLPSDYGDVELEGEIQIERFFWLDKNVQVSTLGHHAGDDNSGLLWHQTDERTVDIHWTHLDGAEEYDLELLFVSHEMPEPEWTLIPNDPRWQNATRITLSELHYKIEMTYEIGRLYYRVRGVGRHGLEMKDRRNGKWRNGNDIIISSSQAYTPTKNWTYSVSYAEEGKRSEVVHFVDGIGRTRQSATKTTTSETVMISEPHYDFEGRASISIMASPVVGSKSLAFYQNYALNDAGAALSPADYDLDKYYDDPNLILPLSSTATLNPTNGNFDAGGGSQRYYSNNNPNKGDGMEAYVPDAEGYPYSVVQYDSRGRVKKASGVGTTHKMGSGHEITTSYGVVFQEEIDKLFGTDVGYAEHYRKKVVEDANGQRIMSYETLTGQVIATAIIGEAPEENGQPLLENLDATGYSYPTTRNETVDFTNYNVFDSDNNRWLISREFSVDEPGVYTFNYAVDEQLFVNSCVTGDCKYEVSLYLYDEYQNLIALKDINEDDIENPVEISLVNDTENPFEFHREFMSGEEGSYIIVKELKLVINEDDLLNVFMDDLEEASNGGQPTTCYDPDDYIIDPNLDDCYEDIIQIANPPNVNNCDEILQQMKIDVSPGGQYFDLWLVNSQIPGQPVGDLSALIAANIGGYYNFSDLSTYWDGNFANELVKIHPEYCYYQWCDELNASTSFNYEFMLMPDDSKYSYMTSCTGSTHGLLSGANADPFFDINGGIGGLALSGGTYNSQMFAIICIDDLYGDAQTQLPSNVWLMYQSLYLETKNTQVNLFIENELSCLPEDSDGDGFIDNTDPNYPGLKRRVSLAEHNLPTDYSEWLDDIDLNGNGELSASELTNYQTQFIADNGICDFAEAAVDISCMVSYVWEDGVLVYNANITPSPSFDIDILDDLGNPVFPTLTITPVNNTLSNCDDALTDLISLIQAKLNLQGSPYNEFTVLYQYTNGSYQIVVRIPPHLAGDFAEFTLVVDGNSDTFEEVPCGGIPPSNCLCEEINYYFDENDASWSSTLAARYNAILSSYTQGGDPFSYTYDGQTWTSALDGTWVELIKTKCDELYDYNTGFDPDDFLAAIPDEMKCWSSENDCDEEEIIITTFFTNDFQGQALTAAAEELVDLFEETCMDAADWTNTFGIDELTMQYTTNARHFMLYYYDQVGNLVHTVPPTGVDMITDPAHLTAVQNIRQANNGVSVVPNHRLRTVYEYNTLNQLTETESPDGGKAYICYDSQGRLRFSVDAHNTDTDVNGNLIVNQFTYVIYDNLGRAVEGGLAKNTNSVGFILQTLQSDTYTDDWAFPRSSSHFTTEQITWTYYDDITGVPTNLQTELNTIFPNGQQQTRGRVVMTSSSYTGDEQNPDAISAYTYDILGNVPELYRYDRLTERWHHFEYDFDMITSNVNEMVYQRGELDEIGYRYFYDADNRLTKSQSSTDGYIWATEEKLFYYVSGMLSRKELGEDKVQGLDYAYTINGWYKGVNAVTLDENMDMGRDGLKTDDATYDTYIYSDDLNANVSRDAFGFSLHFFNDDYKAIGRANATTNQTSFLTNLPSGHSNNLYNGNIGDMVVGLTKPQQAGQAQEAMAPQWTSYRYDQLQRIRSMQSSTTLVFNGSSEHRDEHNWGALGNGYQTNYTYDGNGNILSLLRKNAAGTTIDDLTYFYAASTGATPQGTTTPGQFINNQLLHVNDGTGSTVVDYDIDNQGNNNYKYDNIGNLIKDVAEEIYDIKWRQDGKMHEVIRTAGSQKPNLEFMYNEGGTRIAKIVKPAGSTTWTYTHYVRDVSGNVIATYEQEKVATDPIILTLKEHTIYGSKRVGIIKQSIDVSRAQVQPTGIIEKAWNRERGNKNYELANHLGNVINGVSDLKIRIGDGSGNVLYYEADVHFASDYYPFGMQMKERTFAAQEYTYGFNGQEQDTELYEGSYTAEFWQYDSRLGKRWNKDPVVDPSESSYATNKNNPIKNSDPNGDCSTCPKPSGSFSLKLSYTFGGDRKTSNFNFGVAGNLSANGSIGNALVQGSLNASYMVTNGGITQPFGERNKIRSELIVSPVINIGVGSGAPVNVNYLHNNATTSLSNPIKYSATYSLNNHFTSDGRGQTTATYGVRVGKVSLNVLEDIGYWLGADGKDRYWTGSGNLNFQANNGDVFTLGTDTYTGESINESSDKLDGGFGDTEIGGVITSPGKHKGENFYWANQGQLDGNTGFYQSLNNAQTFLQMNTAYGLDVRMTTTGPMNFWSQNLIHDNLPQPFHHFKPARSKNEFEVTISGGL